MQRFPYGPAPFAILVVTLIAGAYLALNPIAESDATVTMWVFANTHAEAYEAIRGDFEKATGEKIDIQQIGFSAINSRLRAAFWADLDVPDVVEVEISRAGTYFRGPVEEIGFIDLTPYIQRDGLMDTIVKARLAPYTNRGKIFGLPHDVHPVMLAYRADLFEELGIDVDKIETWDDFIAEGRRIAVRDRGENNRFIINLSISQRDTLEVLLFQYGGGYFDADGRLIMDNDQAVELLKWYVPLVAGPNRIAADPGQGGPTFVRAVQDGYCLSFICPDWKSRMVVNDMASMEGKMKLMPLPAFTPGGRRTSTWGGTMVAITRKCPNPQLAWKLMKHLYLDEKTLKDRFDKTYILPPFKQLWTAETFAAPRKFWSNQAVGTEFIRLAGDVPAQYGSPYLPMAKNKIGQVLAAAVNYYEDHGADGLEDFIRKQLTEAANYVRRHVERNPF